MVNHKTIAIHFGFLSKPFQRLFHIIIDIHVEENKFHVILDRT